MHTEVRRPSRTPLVRAGLIILSAVGTALIAAVSVRAEAQADDGDDRVIRSSEGFKRERAPDELRDPLKFEESRTPADRVVVKSRSGGAPNSVQSHELAESYIYDASTELFYDYDRDGYFHYIRVQLDADTEADTALVYAMIFLSADGVAWEHLFTTEDFRIWGTDPDDDYEVESELVSGYSTAQYDVLIELYDAVHGELIDEFGPAESSALAVLPLEDSVRDGVDPGPGPVDDSDGGGGSMTWWAVAALGVALLFARRRRGRERPFETWLWAHPEVLASRDRSARRRVE
jgi:MYXO-CTERM domain-containing protein